MFMFKVINKYVSKIMRTRRKIKKKYMRITCLLVWDCFYKKSILHSKLFNKSLCLSEEEKLFFNTDFRFTSFTFVLSLWHDDIQYLSFIMLYIYSFTASI